MQQITPSPVTMPMQKDIPAANPLALKDIHVPEQITNYPIAYGWWILAIAMIILIVVLLIKTRQRAKLRHHQQQALKQLKNNPDMSETDIIILLKWAAMQYFSRHKLAQLFGIQFQLFLTDKLPEKHQQKFKDLSSQAFSAQYQLQATQSATINKDLHQAAMLWLTCALPPKKQKNNMVTANEELRTSV